MKSLLRREKKQLFGQKKRRKRNKRQKRSPFFPLLDWIFREKRSWRRKGKESAGVEKKKLEVNTQLEIASEKVTDIPSDFFQVVTASGLDLSEFSGNSINDIPHTVEKSVIPESDRKRRNYKRHNNLFISSTPSWSGYVEGSNNCPAYLISSKDVLTSSVCVTSPSLSVIFSTNRTVVTRVTLHPVLHLALLTTHTPLTNTPLCHPEEFIHTLLDTRHTQYSSQDLKDWLEQAAEGEL